MVKALRDTIWLARTDWSYSWAHWPAFWAGGGYAIADPCGWEPYFLFLQRLGFRISIFENMDKIGKLFLTCLF